MSRVMLTSLVRIRDCLQRENERGAISDTLWISEHETLFDFLDAVISAAACSDIAPDAAPTEDQKIAREISEKLLDAACGRQPISRMLLLNAAFVCERAADTNLSSPDAS